MSHLSRQFILSTQLAKASLEHRQQMESQLDQVALEHRAVEALDDIGSLESAVSRLEQLSDTLESFGVESLSEQGATLAQLSLNHICDDLGISGPTVSQESTVISMEADVKSIINRIIEAIRKAFKVAWDAMMNFIKRASQNADKISDRVQVLKKQVEDLDHSNPSDGSLNADRIRSLKDQAKDAQHSAVDGEVFHYARIRDLTVDGKWSLSKAAFALNEVGKMLSGVDRVIEEYTGVLKELINGESDRVVRSINQPLFDKLFKNHKTEDGHKVSTSSLLPGEKTFKLSYQSPDVLGKGDLDGKVRAVFASMHFEVATIDEKHALDDDHQAIVLNPGAMVTVLDLVNDVAKGISHAQESGDTLIKELQEVLDKGSSITGSLDAKNHDATGDQVRSETALYAFRRVGELAIRMHLEAVKYLYRLDTALLGYVEASLSHYK